MRIAKLAASILLASVGYSQAQVVGTVHDFQTKGWAKAENGLVMSWQFKAEDPAADQINVADIQGHPIAKLKVLSAAPEAGKAYVYDVSSRPGGLIAVAAVYVSKQGVRSVRPASALLLFDRGGTLLSFFSLAPWRDILRLEVDDQSNIWTLTSNAEEGQDTGRYSMLVEYTTKGAVVKELLSRKLFPRHADEIRGDNTVGFAAMGYESDKVWFWLPGSTELVTVPTKGGSPTITKTGVPSEGTSVPANMILNSAGELFAEFREAQKSRGYYKWSPSTKAWVRFKPGACNGGWLVGSDRGSQVYLLPNASNPSDADTCAFDMQ